MIVGQSILTDTAVTAMGYDGHFRERLRSFRERVVTGEQLEGDALDALSASKGFAGLDLRDWRATVYGDDEDHLVRDSCDRNNTERQLCHRPPLEILAENW